MTSSRKLKLDVGMRLGQVSKQEEFVMDDTTPFLLYRGGRGASKTASGWLRMERLLYNNPGTKGICLVPDYNKTTDGVLATALELTNPDFIANFDRSPPQRMEFDNGDTKHPNSRCTFYTASDPNVTRSMEVNYVWFDEAPYCPEQAWKVALGCKRYRPARGVVNSMWATGTPRGYDWTYNIFGENGKPGFKAFVVSIYENAHHLPKGYIRDMEFDYKGTDFELQELLGQYTLFEGLVYPQFDGANMYTDADMKFDVGVGGIDLGDIAPSVLVPLGTTSHGGLWCPEEFYGRRVPTSVLMENMARMEQEYKIAAWFCETTAEFFITSARAAGFDVRPCPIKDVESGIRVVQQYFRDDLLRLNPERCPNGVRELRTYQHKGRDRVESFSDTLIKANDHFPDALRYGVCGYERSNVAPVSIRPYKPADALYTWEPQATTPYTIRRDFVRNKEKTSIGTW